MATAKWESDRRRGGFLSLALVQVHAASQRHLRAFYVLWPLEGEHVQERSGSHRIHVVR